MKTSFCPNCGYKIAHTDKFCNNCGARIEQSSDDDTMIIEDTETTPLHTHLDNNSGRSSETIADSFDSRFKDGQYATSDTTPDDEEYESEEEESLNEKKKKTVWIWLVPLMLVLAVLAAGTVYYFGFRSNESLRDKPEETTEQDKDSGGSSSENDEIKVYEEPDKTTQTTPDLVFNFVHGPVKSIVTDDGKIEFDALGNMSVEPGIHYSRDAHGYITASEREVDGYTLSIVYTFDGKRYNSFLQEYNGTLYKYAYTYNDNGTVKTLRITSPNFSDAEIVYNFYDYTFDSMHNWISRSYTIQRNYSDSYGSKQQDQGEGSDHRRISYY